MRFLLAIVLIGACKKSAEPPPGADETTGTDTIALPTGDYRAEIRWTGHGIPHVVAEDWGGVGFGHGYAVARAHACTLADLVVKVRSERSRWFGPGPEDAHLEEDLGWKALGLYAQAEATVHTLPLDASELLNGYAVGFNQYLDEVGPAGLPDGCANAPWVGPVTPTDLFALQLHLSRYMGGWSLARAVGQAQPPARAVRPPPPSLDLFARFARPTGGSNGWALGRNLTEERRGALLTDLHLPDSGELLLHEVHLTLPGTLDVYGAAFVGLPVPSMGFNARVAWTHTASTTPRFTVYALELDPADPTQYRFGGSTRRMDSVEYTVDVLQPNGETTEVTRTLYRTHLGPVFNAPLVGWTDTTAFAFRDANADNTSAIAHWLHLAKADDLVSFTTGHEVYQGVPWMHTLYADADGTAWYGETAPAPNLSRAAEIGYLEYLEDNEIAASYAETGVIVLPGNATTYDWSGDPDAAHDGTVPFAEVPQLTREDYVANANNGARLANPLAPLDDLQLLYGTPETPLSPRARANLFLLTDVVRASGPDQLWSLDELEAAQFAGDNALAILLKDQVVERCADDAALTAACDALDAWGGTYALDDPGAVLWRELVGGFDDADRRDAGALFAEPFDPDDPIDTPSGLATPPEVGPDPVLVALGAAADRLASVGLGVGATLRDTQHRTLDGTRWAVPGGPPGDGALMVAAWDDLADSTLLTRPTREAPLNAATGLVGDGTYPTNTGSAWLLAVAFTGGGPQARALLAYGQSADAASPHRQDQAALLAGESLRPVRFTEADVLADPDLVVQELTTPR